MPEARGHCPYVGLKQNRSIRFASPTPEHRCYIAGDPIEIPVDQAHFCLSADHVRCPLYTGSTPPTTPTNTPTEPATTVAISATGGLRGWLTTLPNRERRVYALMLGILGTIILMYLVIGIQALRDLVAPVVIAPTSISTAQPTLDAPTFLPLPTDITTQPTAPSQPSTTPVVSIATATITPIALNQNTAVPSPTTPPTAQIIATATPIPATSLPTQVPTQTAPNNTAVPTRVPVQPTNIPPTRLPTAVPTIPPTPEPPVLPPTAVSPNNPAPLPPTPAPQPPVESSTRLVTLYFGDTTGSLYVPVQRYIRIENNQIAAAAIRELIAGSRSGLQSLILPDVKLLQVIIQNGIATVNIDRQLTVGGDQRGYYAVTLTLTEFPTVQRVTFQVNGQPITVGGRVHLNRPTVNPLNPAGLAEDANQTSFLPLYFPSNSTGHVIRVIRLVPKTRQVAEQTLRSLLEGPSAYGYALQRPIPAGTELRGLRLENGTLIADFTRLFLEAPNRQAAVNTVVQSLTSLPTIQRVMILVEGESLGMWWGGEFGQVYGKPLINPE